MLAQVCYASNSDRIYASRRIVAKCQFRTHAPQQRASYSITSSAIASSVVGMSRPQQSRMWTPRRGRQQLDLLCHDKQPELRGKAFHEVLVGEEPCPVLPPVGVVIKLPEMDELDDRAS